MSNPLSQTLFDIFRSLRMQQQQCQTGCDCNADSLTTRQRVTSAQIADVWKITALGAAGVAQQSIKQRACGGGRTAWFEKAGHENK